MNKRRGIAALGLVLAIFLAALLVYPTSPPEPVYQGTRLSAWLEDLPPSFFPPTFVAEGLVLDTFASRRERAIHAVRSIGTNANPTLRHMLKTRDSPVKVMVIRRSRRLSWLNFDWKTAAEKHDLA